MKRFLFLRGDIHAILYMENGWLHFRCGYHSRILFPAQLQRYARVLLVRFERAFSTSAWLYAYTVMGSCCVLSASKCLRAYTLCAGAVCVCSDPTKNSIRDSSGIGSSHLFSYSCFPPNIELRATVCSHGVEPSDGVLLQL